MKVFTQFLLIALLTSQASHAQSNLTLVDLNKKIDNLNRQIPTVREQVKKLESDYTLAEQARLDAEASYESANSAWKDTAGGIFGFFRGTGDSVKRDALEKAKKSHNSAKADSRRIFDDVNNLKTSQEEISNALASNLEARENMQRSILILLRADNLVSDFQRVQDKIGNNELALKILQAQYDNSTLGAYVQSKMTALMNSDLFCRAQTNCSGSKITPVTNAEMKDKIFKTEDPQKTNGARGSATGSSGAR